MSRLSIGSACIQSGSVYVNLMNWCDRIEVIGQIRDGAPYVDELEFLVIPKSDEILRAGLEERYGSVISFDEFEIVFEYEGTQVSLIRATRESWDRILSSMMKAA